MLKLHRQLRSLILIGVLRLAVALLWAGGWSFVAAHADYDHSEPAAEAVIPTAPAEVRVWFTQELFRREGANALEVYSATGARVDGNDTRINDDDRSLMVVSLEADLPPETYTVKWRSLSADDGHDGSGEFYFTVGTADETTAPAQPQPAATATIAEAAVEPESAANGGLACLNGIIFGTVGIGLVMVSRRQGSSL